MSNYRFGLAVANHIGTINGMPGKIVSPTDDEWWTGLSQYICRRYDTPEFEKEAVQKKFLPVFLYWQGEDVFHYMHSERIAHKKAFYRRYLPKEHPIHRIMKEDEYCLSAYGGDYWLNALCSNCEFWKGLHNAGTRGLFVIEIGCEHSIRFQDFEYALYGVHSNPAWYLIVADLRHDTEFTLERVYPRQEDVQGISADDYLDSDLHFYTMYEGRIIKEAVSNPYRETISYDNLPNPLEPWSL